MTELSDELLVAYVDGQLAHDQSLAVERVLQNDDIAAQRVEAMRAAHSRLEAAFEAMLANELTALAAVPGNEPEAAPPVKPRSAFTLLRRGGTVAVLGGAMAMLTAGAVAGYALRATPVPLIPVPREKVPLVSGASAARDWQDDLVIAQSLFTRDSLSVGLESQGNIDLLRFHLGNLLGAEIQIPDLGPYGLTFKRAQLLRRDGITIVQLAYLPLKGGPVSLYLQWDKGGGTDAHLTMTDDVAAAEWRQENITYLLAGRMPLPAMKKLAANVRERIAAKQSLASEPMSAAEAREMAEDPAPAEVYTGQAGLSAAKDGVRSTEQ